MEMESMPYHPLFLVTREQMITVRQCYDLDAKKVNENLDAIEDWCKKQDHLVEALPYLKRDIMERFHIIGRGSNERTKNIIEKVLTIRRMLPEFLPNNQKIFINEFDIFLDNILITPLPKANPIDGTRIFLYRLMNENFEDINLLDFAKWDSFITEIRLHYEYIFSDRVIIDFKHIKANVITKINPVILRKLEVMFTEAYKIKIKGIHLINAPPFINKIIYLAKQVIKEKLARRIYVHSSYEELYQEIPKEVLPKDYGGELASCSDFVQQWKDYLKSDDAKRIIENSSKLVSDESKRSSIRFNEEYLGMPGSFKQLNVD